MIINDLYNNKKIVAEVSDKTLISYLQKVSDDSLKHDQDPSKRSAEKRNRSVSGFAQAFNKLDSRKPDDSVKENNSESVTHRIGLTVTDPNHPMVSKRGETYQKSVRVTGPDREAAINQAIAHYRRKGYKVHDHHYLGTVDQGVEEAKKKKNRKSSRAMGGYFFPGYGYYGSGESGEGGGDGGGESANRDMAEASLGDYRKKAMMSRAMAQTNRFFDRDDPAAVATADKTIAKRERGMARADARVKPYTPPAQDAEKMQRDLTAKYPNIDELVAKAEQRRDPNYDYAEGNAYYDGREAEQNYQKLKQIQRVIQGLNESLDRSHLP
jgi:hypothetical protein